MPQPNRYLNVAANYAGIASTLLVHVLLIPVYVHLLGAESYGLIGFFLTVQAVLQTLDLGLGMALNRELARRTATRPANDDTVDLVRTLEWVSLAVAAALGFAIWLSADVLATSWLVPQTLSTTELRAALGLMGLALAVQWPSSIYTGGLMGLQRQAIAASVTVSGNIVFAVGIVALLQTYPSVNTFFVWRAACSLLVVLAQRQLLWSGLPGQTQTTHPRLDLRATKSIWPFAIGMSGVSVTGVFLMQLDKIIVSNALTLDAFGIYMVASTAAALIPQLVSPVFATTLPPLWQAAALADAKSLHKYFHVTSQFISTFVHPVACVIAVFAAPLLILWTRDTSIATGGAMVLSVLAAGALLNSIMVPLYAVQLACGWTRLATVTNCVLISIMLPYAAFAANRWGAIGAASTWLVLNAVYVFIGATLTLRRLLPGAAASWIFRDVVAPLLWTVSFVTAARAVAPSDLHPAATFVLLGIVTGIAILGAAAISPEIRRRAGHVVRVACVR